MKNNICSENYKKFFRSILVTGLSLSELTDVIGENLHLVASDLSIGRFLSVFNTPPSPMGQEANNVVKDLYVSSEGYEDKPVTVEIQTGDNGFATFSVYPVKGYNWSDEEADEVRFFCQILFVVCGRTRLSHMVENSIFRDGFTGLPNANGFIAMGRALAAQNKLCGYTAMFVNLKNFRRINAQVGNRNGDKVISAYSKALLGQLSEGEIAARLGGDNFTLLVKNERTDYFINFLSSVNIAVIIGEAASTFALSAHIGVYHIEQGDKMTHVMNCISSAVSAAKRNHNKGDVVVFDQEAMKRIDREQAVSAMFPEAIRNREFVVYYQPKVDLTSNVMCGCEALVRWKQGDSIIPPAEFIPVFERDGNICALDFYMLENVCRHINEWVENGLEPVTVSVNFSKTHLYNPNIGEEIMAVINKYGVDSRYIEIELTEMSDYNDYEAFKNLVTKMKNNGVLTSIDDFGTGYSSLNLLTDFNFDVVKLDKSFLDNIIRSGSKTDEIVVRNIVRMVKELDMKAIAEGVETTEQARFLKDIDCSMVQGYLYDKPLPVEEFVKRLQKKTYSTVI